MGSITSVEGPRPGTTAAGRAIAGHGYVEEEYVLRGTADLFTYDGDRRPVVLRPDLGFVTRILVRRPAEAGDATGSVVIEPLHPAGDMASAWPRTGRMLTREGWSWVGVTQDLAGLAATKAGDPDRYRELDIPELGLGFDIVATVATWLRTGAVDGLVLDHLFMTGASYTGTFQRVFLGEGFHDRARRSDGGPAVEGYLIQISSGGFLLGGYHPISEAAGRPPADHPPRVIQPRDVPVIELLSEGEAETNLRSRRDDSDAPGDRYRLYEVPGACHMSRGESSGSLLPETVEEPSTFPMYALAGGALENLRRWAVEGVAPPRAPRIELREDARRRPPRRGTGDAAPGPGRARQRRRRRADARGRRAGRVLLPAFDDAGAGGGGPAGPPAGPAGRADGLDGPVPARGAAGPVRQPAGLPRRLPRAGRRPGGRAVDPAG